MRIDITADIVKNRYPDAFERLMLEFSRKVNPNNRVTDPELITWSFHYAIRGRAFTFAQALQGVPEDKSTPEERICGVGIHAEYKRASSWVTIDDIPQEVKDEVNKPLPPVTDVVEELLAKLRGPGFTEIRIK